ncbi:multidrug transporter [Sphingomonas sp. Leaf412]|uniref:SapC family protein n=1 Tax=Sphingomonas sp. Leaf412 TaxID=1736370 RepID=UPI0006F591DC|nr:SapC family protein [Sphingomonas sp. Leaf412]KQT31751.1 multidrug transporter [Sphingomonas sp. Leaf412]
MTHAILNADDHRTLRIDTSRGADRGDAQMACLLTPDEFRRAQDEYAILFRQNATRDRVDAYALLGFENGENLYLAGDRWDARYVPLAMDIQPFLIGRGGESAQVHVDMDHPRISAGGEGVRVFDDLGRATPYFEGVVERLGRLDAGYRAAAAFVTALERYDLLEPLTLEVTLDSGATNRLVGFLSVDEERLRALDAAALGDLHRDGHLLPLFMAVASLGNIGRLVARKNAAGG